VPAGIAPLTVVTARAALVTEKTAMPEKSIANIE
jgi:hypothetical protein